MPLLDAQKGQLLSITIEMYGKAANFKEAYLWPYMLSFWNLQQLLKIFVTYQLNKIQVARGNCNYFILKGFNMWDIYCFTAWLLCLKSCEWIAAHWKVSLLNQLHVINFVELNFWMVTPYTKLNYFVIIKEVNCTNAAICMAVYSYCMVE